jgi:hypothetical protein
LSLDPTDEAIHTETSDKNSSILHIIKVLEIIEDKVNPHCSRGA